ncbi:MAG: glycosyltransferase [Pseudonocardia sp.]|uniref:glycosyltransferase n=1 Tax=unclassified Pseudonocardia TaxID=2619320 RepID=UPI00086C00BD|nr:MULTISPECIES: glycosyltransferase [unclassified Pseudonocardia]MBN9107360.1 glycosyltransferase [Pseudonocardia sp.]ODU26668.1 MAG: glycosyl transferase family 1 [Pseudonocardia sp. SCN 72-51]ODV06601.1 MAG: glycosyl transferase family 1 [Pseudonocardia sp. SCN 73-27]
MTPLRIALIASSNFPIAEPFAGGLEAHTALLARELTARGHDVTVFAAPGSDVVPGARVEEMPVLAISDVARGDVSMPPARFMAEHHAYLDLMLRLARGDEFDVVHNNSLHHLPVAMARTLPVPLVTTLHTPPTPWLESAVVTAGGRHGVLTAVSSHTAGAWRHVADGITVIHNGVDVEARPHGPGGGPLVWAGRIVPEKGAHLAIRAARAADRPLLLAGPVSDPGYFAEAVAPLLGGTVRHVGHLPHPALTRLVARAAAMLVTPSWEEPYGLVVAEALACGTPVAGFAVGALPEIVDDSCGRLVPAGDTDALAAVIPAVEQLSRSAARRRAELRWSHRRMVDQYEALYRRIAA